LVYNKLLDSTQIQGFMGCKLFKIWSCLGFCLGFLSFYICFQFHHLWFFLYLKFDSYSFNWYLFIWNYFLFFSLNCILIGFFLSNFILIFLVVFVGFFINTFQPISSFKIKLIKDFMDATFRNLTKFMRYAMFFS